MTTSDSQKQALEVISGYKEDKRRLSAVYDDDPALQSALASLIPDFEYPDHSHVCVQVLAHRLLKQHKYP